VEEGGEVGGEVGYRDEDEITVIGMMKGVELVLIMDLGLQFVLAMEFVQIGSVKLRWSSLGIQVEV
jgi:hypothetical protein